MGEFAGVEGEKSAGQGSAASIQKKSELCCCKTFGLDRCPETVGQSARGGLCPGQMQRQDLCGDKEGTEKGSGLLAPERKGVCRTQRARRGSGKSATSVAKAGGPCFSSWLILTGLFRVAFLYGLLYND